MPLYLTNLPVIANSDINPSTFVMIDPTRDNAVVQASGVTSILIGVSQAGTKAAPNLVTALGGTAGGSVAANAGDQLEIFTGGDVCGLTVGSGAGVAAGDALTTATNGTAVTATSTQRFGAVALHAANANEIVQVYVMSGKV